MTPEYTPHISLRYSRTCTVISQVEFGVSIRREPELTPWPPRCQATQLINTVAIRLPQQLAKAPEET